MQKLNITSTANADYLKQKWQIPLLDVHNISLSYGGIKVLKDVSFSVEEGHLSAIIGPNGAGKTSLLNCISGFYKADNGQILFDGDDITSQIPFKIAQMGIARTFQNVKLFSNMNVIDNLLLGRHNHFKSGYFRNALLGYRTSDEARERRRVEEILDFLEIEQWRKHLVSDLPYGIQKLVEH